jgi:hypothetical protein
MRRRIRRTAAASFGAVAMHSGHQGGGTRPLRSPRHKRLGLPILVLCGGAISFSSPVYAGAVQDTGFLSKPTDQIAVPGLAAGAEITPEGDLYTGWAEYELRFGSPLRNWNQPTRTLANPSVPVLSSTLDDGPVRYTDSVFAVALAGSPVAYETITAENTANAPRRAQVAMQIAYTRGHQINGAHGLPTAAFRYERPVQATAAGFYDQPGEAFSPTFSYSLDGRDLDRSGLLLARGPVLPSRPLPSPTEPESQTAAHDAQLFSFELAPHHRITLTWQIPLDPPAATADSDRTLDSTTLSVALTRLRESWRSEEAGMMQLELPEARVVATYRAALTEMLESRVQTPSGWVQGSNKLQYQAFWIRDAAIVTQALDLAGLHRQAAEDLSFLDAFQQPDGLFISRAQQYDGLGQALWALDQHAQLSGSADYARAQLDRMQAAVEWLRTASASDPLGLLPAGNPNDDELAYGHTTGDDLWAATGLRSAVEDARLAGREDLAASWLSIDRRFEASLGRAVESMLAASGHITPDIEAGEGQDWGNYYAAYPIQVLSARSAAVRNTLTWARAHIAEGLPTYDDARSLHDYLGFAVFQTELEAGESARAIAGLYAELAHTTSTDGGWEWDIAPFGDRDSAVDLSPHGTFAGDYVALLRNMLIAESGPGLELLSGASPDWLAPGRHIKVSGAPTDRGVISFTERSSSEGETLRWSGSLAKGTPLSWKLPSWARDARVQGRPVRSVRIMLHGSSGSLTVKFSGVRPQQSYAGAVAALNHAYRAHSRRAPIVPITDR